MLLAGIFARKLGYVSEERVTLKIAVKVFLDAIPSLLLIVIIIGGILLGVFTATEGSAIAVVYSVILSLIYRSITWKDIPKIILQSAHMTGVITFMIGLSSIMSWVMAFTAMPDLIANAILSISGSKIVILVVLILVTYIPQISMFLPTVLGLV